MVGSIRGLVAGSTPGRAVGDIPVLAEVSIQDPGVVFTPVLAEACIRVLAEVSIQDPGVVFTPVLAEACIRVLAEVSIQGRAEACTQDHAQSPIEATGRRWMCSSSTFASTDSTTSPT